MNTLRYYKDLTKPALLTLPSDEVDEGSSVVFVCHAEGSLPITYTWYNKNNMLLQQSSSYSLSNIFQVTNVKRSKNSTSYRCRAFNSAGWKESTSNEIVVRCKSFFSLFFVSDFNSPFSLFTIKEIKFLLQFFKNILH